MFGTRANVTKHTRHTRRCIGQSMAEYGLLLALIALVALGGFQQMGLSLQGSAESIASSMGASGGVTNGNNSPGSNSGSGEIMSSFGANVENGADGNPAHEKKPNTDSDTTLPTILGNGGG